MDGPPDARTGVPARDSGGFDEGHITAAPAPPPAWARVTALAAIFVVWLIHRAHWRFTCDDAYISFRYAENLARRGALVFNTDPVEYVEGYTNFLWVIALALGERVGFGSASTSEVLGVLAGAAALLGAAAAVERVGGPTAARWSWIAPAVLALLPEFVVWTTSGLETAAVVAAGLWAFVAVLDDRPARAAALTITAALLRLDALVWVLPLVGLGGVWRVRDGGIARVRGWAAALAAVLGVLVAHTLARWAYYGAWVPNTWVVKQHGAALAGTWGWAYVRTWMSASGVWLLAPAVGLAWLPRREDKPGLLPWALLASLLSVTAWAWSVGGDFMAYSRLLLPATVLWVVLAALGVNAAASARAPAAGGGRTLARVYAVLAIALAVSAIPSRLALDREGGWLDARFESVTAMDHFARVRVAAGTWMRTHLPATTRVSVGAAGALPYASGLPTLDVYGLTDAEVARTGRIDVGDRARPGHQVMATAALIRRRDPDLMCHAGLASASLPSPALARRHGPYAWACVPVGEIDDSRGSGERLDGGYYCCLRPVGRTVGPFADDAPMTGAATSAATSSGTASDEGGEREVRGR